MGQKEARAQPMTWEFQFCGCSASAIFNWTSNSVRSLSSSASPLRFPTPFSSSSNYAARSHDLLQGHRAVPHPWSVALRRGPREHAKVLPAGPVRAAHAQEDDDGTEVEQE